MATPYVVVDYSSLSIEPNFVEEGEKELDPIEKDIIAFCERFLEVSERLYRRKSYKPPTENNLRKKPYYPSMYEFIGILRSRGIPIDSYIRYLYEKWKARRKRPVPKHLVEKFGNRLEGIECPSFMWAARKDVQGEFLAAPDGWLKPVTLTYESKDTIVRATLEAGDNAVARLQSMTGRSRDDLLLDFFVLSTLPFSYVEHVLQDRKEEFKRAYGITVEDYLRSRLKGMAHAC